MLEKLEDKVRTLQTANEYMLVITREKDNIIAEVEAENASLRDNLMHAEAEINALEREVHELDDEVVELRRQVRYLTDELNNALIEVRHKHASQAEQTDLDQLVEIYESMNL